MNQTKDWKPVIDFLDEREQAREDSGLADRSLVRFGRKFGLADLVADRVDAETRRHERTTI
jgi:hypothetical protein